MRSAEAQRAPLLVDSWWLQTLNLSEQGSSDVQHTAGSAFCLARLVGRILGDGLAARPGTDIRRDRLHRSAHDLSSAANCRRVGRRSLVQLPPRAFEAALVELEAGAD